VINLEGFVRKWFDLIKILYWYLPGRVEEKHEKPKSA
jgi:hypothetical protein